MPPDDAAIDVERFHGADLFMGAVLSPR